MEGVDEGLLTKGVQMPEADPSSLTPTQVAPSTHVSAPARKHHKQFCSTTKHSSTAERLHLVTHSSQLWQLLTAGLNPIV